MSHAAVPKAAQTATRGLSVFQRESLNLRLVHPRWDVALFLQHTPDVYVLVALDVEDQVVVDGLLHVPVGKLPWDDALHDFRVAVRLPIRLRSVAKYALSAAAAAGGRRLVRITQAAK